MRKTLQLLKMKLFASLCQPNPPHSPGTGCKKSLSFLLPIWGALREGEDKSNCPLRANRKRSRKGQCTTQADTNPSPLLLSDPFPSTPNDKAPAKSESVGSRGQENTAVPSKVTNLIKPSQIKYCLRRRVHPSLLWEREARIFHVPAR